MRGKMQAARATGKHPKPTRTPDQFVIAWKPPSTIIPMRVMKPLPIPCGVRRQTPDRQMPFRTMHHEPIQ
jgi:hypothetical protein